MTLPPLYLVGFFIFIALFFIRLVYALLRGHNVDLDSTMGFMFSAFEVALAVYASVEIFHFTFFGAPFPGSSIEEIQLSVSFAAVALLCAAAYQYIKKLHVGAEDQTKMTCPKCGAMTLENAKFCSACGEKLK